MSAIQTDPAPSDPSRRPRKERTLATTLMIYGGLLVLIIGVWVGIQKWSGGGAGDEGADAPADSPMTDAPASSVQGSSAAF